MSDSGNRPILVTQPSLPPLAEFVPYLEQIWDSKVLTNSGPMHQRFEAALASYLGADHLALFNNGTTALLTALQAMNLSGEVITTPFSFAATAHSILWNGLVPVFVDIDPTSLNLDARRLEEAITERTSAILPVHCYGRPCDVGNIRAVAERHGLKVIYDAAHAFGVTTLGESVVRHGDLSVLSFHATKVFNTFEGGAIVCPDAATKLRIDRLKNFGIVNESSIETAGLNGKMNEVQAAFGILQLQYVDEAIARRRQVDRHYRKLLTDVEGIFMPPLAAATAINGAYFPILIRPEFPLSRDRVYERLLAQHIMARRYFYPLLSSLPMYRHLPSASLANLPNAQRIAEQVICLPIHAALSESDVDRIAGVLLS